MARKPVLAGFFVALAISISGTEILLAVLIFFSLWRLLARLWEPLRGLRPGAHAVWTEAEPLRRHPLTLPFLCWTGLTLVSAVASGNAGWSLWMARDTLRIAAFYIVLGSTRDVPHARRLWEGFLVTLTLMAAYGLAQGVFCGRLDSVSASWLAEICIHPSRVRGPYSIYMTFGVVLMLGILLCLAQLAQRSWRHVGWMIPAAVLMATTLALTYARNAWLGLAAGVLELVVMLRRVGPVALVLGGLLLGVAAVGPAAVLGRVRSLADPHDPTVRDRVAMWRSGWAMVHDHPMLGVGPGQVRAWYPFYRRPEAVRPSTGHLHNSAIHLAAERGLPALAVWIWLWVVFFREGGRVWARLGSDRSGDRALVAASLAGVTAFLVAGLFEHTFGNGVVVMIIYALMALPFTVQREHTSAESTCTPARAGYQSTLGISRAPAVDSGP